MRITDFVAAVVIGLACLCSQSMAQDGGFRFLATGDVPYVKAHDAEYRALVKQSLEEDFAFMVHVGDIKSGSTPCTDESFIAIRDVFRDYPKPVVYTPGDNEWTDCRGEGVDPVERLARLRELFFADPTTLRLGQLKTVHQSRDAKYAKFSENYRFQRSGVHFIVAHVVGSRNNRNPDVPSTIEEFSERNAANVAFLKESFAEAISQKATAVSVIIHANPGFEKGAEKGFAKFLSAMRKFLAEYHRPVLCIHGDSHYYRIDKPIKLSTGRIFTHFTRMEVFGSPNVAGVDVRVDPNDPEVFSFRPYYLKQAGE